MPIAYDEVREHLSNNRLQTYRTRLTTNASGLTMPKVVKAYYLLNDVSQHFFVPLQLVEVVLRNKLSDYIKGSRGTSEWYKTVPATPEAQRLVLQAVGQATKDVAGLRKITADDVICRLTFGFWVNLIGKPYRDTTTPEHFLWDQHSYRIVFSGTPKEVKINEVFNSLRSLNQLRNRLFHHETIWASTRVNSLDLAIIEITDKYENLLKILGWLSPELLALYKAWGFSGRMSKAADSSRFDRNLW